jgi:adenylate cyclase
LNTSRLSLRTLIWGSCLVLLAVLTLQRLFPGVIGLFELNTVDHRFQLRQALGMAPSYSDRLVHINIDDFSKKQSGESFWLKTVYADLIDRIAQGGAVVIATDIMFVDWADKTGNDELAQSLARAGNVVSPILLALPPAGSARPPPPALALGINPRIDPDKALHAVGVLDLPLVQVPDPDGVVRRTPMVAELGGALVPSFFLQALATYLDYDLENIMPVDGSRLLLKDFPSGVAGERRDLPVALDGAGNLVVNLAGPFDLDVYPQSYSAWDLLQAEAPPDFSGKLVVLADTSVQHGQYGDVSPVPLERAFPRAYIWSNAASSLLTGQLIRPAGSAFAEVAAVVLGLLLVLVCWQASTLWFTVISLGVIVLYVAAAFGSFVWQGWLLPLLPVLTPLLAIYVFTSVYRYARMERYEGILEGSLESYLSPTLMDRIKDDPEMLRLGGARKRITVLFSDIVNFTAFSDEADPQEIQEVLEEYFGKSASVIFSEDGIIDKYMGDGILAFFENEGGDITSAGRAASCALRLQEEAAAIDRRHREQNLPPFAIRVGMATGYAKVGNIGPAEKIDYTVIGSVVNLASRLQGIGDSGDIIIDEDTCFFVKARHSATDLGEQSLKGFSHPVRAYKLARGADA